MDDETPGNYERALSEWGCFCDACGKPIDGKPVLRHRLRKVFHSKCLKHRRKQIDNSC